MKDNTRIQTEQKWLTYIANKRELRALEFPSTVIHYLTRAKLFTQKDHISDKEVCLERRTDNLAPGQRKVNAGKSFLQTFLKRIT